MPIQKVALVFDNQVRPDTTGIYCRRALGGLVDVEHFLPSELGRVPRRGFDLYLNIDDGLQYRWPTDLHPCAWWAIDTHLNYEWCRARARDFDFLFAAQRDGARQLLQDGSASSTWLPLACDPELHCPRLTAQHHDICFVGHLFPGPRTELLELIRRRFSNVFVGQRFFEALAHTYSASRIVFNRSIRNDVNMRVFEALACGSLLVTNDLSDNGQAELFQDGVHLVTYRDPEELLERLAFYLEHAKSRERIAAAGRAEALARHTYRHRMQRLLAAVEANSVRSAQAVTGSTSEPVTTELNTDRRPPTDFGLTSIVILTHNQLDFTRQCVDSLRRHTEPPHELIFVDNASTDGTVDYLRRELPQALVIVNAENRGFPAAANQGIRAASGQQILLLNNDTVVPAGWLQRLLRALHGDAQIGLAGPCSNFVSGPQQVMTGYTDLAELDDFARDREATHRHVLEDSDRLVGFCLLIRREVIDRIGLLDERFGLGCFEDDDYCRRALQAGYRAVIARDAFVHHYGGRTFVGSQVDFGALMRRNQALFAAKWQSEPTPPPSALDSAAETVSPVIDHCGSRYGLRQAVGGGLLLERSARGLSLCMIVRDSARTLEACLQSIRPWVDEMVVVDTGSTDDTPQIAARCGARVFHFPWCDSFAAARNESLRHARGQWVFWMDADDVIDAANGRQLRALLSGNAPPTTLGYVLQVHCPGPPGDEPADVTVVDHVKVFRNLPALRFEGRIHEQILPAIRRAGGDVAWTDLHVVHAGYDHSAEGQQRKIDRDLHLLGLELQEQPDHPFTLFNLGMTYADVGDYDRATAFLRKSIDRSGPGESHLRKAYALLVYSYQRQGKSAEARRSCDTGLALFPQDPELRFRSALLLHEAGQLPEAAALYRGLLEPNGERAFSSLDRGITSHKARQNLALVYADQGRLDLAEAQWRRITDDVPSYRRGWYGLGTVLLAQGQGAQVRQLAERLHGNETLLGVACLLEGQQALAQGHIAAAQNALQAAHRHDPDDPEIAETYCRFLFEHGPPEEAAAALRQRVQRQPTDAAAHHNLGLICLRLGRYPEAVAACRDSLRLRPGCAATYGHLSQALAKLGRQDEAVAAWQQALVLDPDHAQARAALGAARAGHEPPRPQSEAAGESVVPQPAG